jgi:uncharacterized membrane protein YbhN (UPF0104 family)
VALWATKQEPPRFPTAPGDIALIGLGTLVYAIATLARGYRWHTILRHGGIDHSPVDAFALVAVGYMGNTVLPARGGELLRIVLLGERSSARRREILGTVLGERLLDAATLALLFVILTLAHVAENPAGSRPGVIAAGTLVLGALVIVNYLRLRRRGHFEGFAARVRPVARAAKPLLTSLGAALATLTLGVWLLEGLIVWLVGHALHVDISLLEACFVLVLTAFFSLVPAAPGYVGTFDAAVVFGLKALDVTGGQAVAFGVLLRFILFFPITIVGLVALIARYGGLRRLRRA